MKIADLIAKIGVDTRELDRGLGKAMRKFKSFGASTKRLGRNMSAGITAPLAAIAGVSFKVAADFEQNMAAVAAVSGASAEQFKALEKNALDLGSSTKYTASEVAGLQLEFAKLGFTSGEIQKVTQSTLDLATASGSDLATSAEVAGATLRGFGLDASETQRVTDVMAASFSSSALDMSTFAESMKYVAPVAKSAGMSIEQTSSMLAVLSNAGIKGSQAGTALRRIISELGATGGDVAGAIENLATKGLNLADAKDEVGRSAQSALLVLSKNMGAAKELQTSFEGAEGAAAKMAGTMGNTAQGDMARMQSAIEGAQIALGRALAPTMSKIMGVVGKLANAFTNMDGATRSTVITIAAIVAAIGPLLAILPTVIAGAGALGGALAGAFGMLLSPVGLAIAAIAAIAAAIFYFWDDVKQPLANVINTFISLYNENEGIRVAIAVLKMTFIASFKIMKRAVMTVVDSFALLFKAVKTAFTDGFSAAGDVLMQGINDMKDDIVETGAEVYEDYKGAIDDAKKRDPIELVTTEDLDRGKAYVESLLDFSSTFAGGSRVTGETATAESGGGEEMQQMQARGIQTNVAEPMLMVAENTQQATTALSDFNTEVATSIDLGGDIAGAFVGIGEGIAQMAMGTMTMKGFLGSMLERLGDLLKQIGSGFIAAAVAAKQFYANLIANPVAAIAAGVALVAAGAIVSMLGGRLAEQPPQMADGGVVFGRTMVEVGEYSNANINPEVIAPLDKLQSMIGGGQNNVTVHGKISGKDILLSMDRSSRDRARVKGI